MGHVFISRRAQLSKCARNFTLPERAQKRLVAGEELVLVVDGGVARQYQRIRHVLLAAAVDDVEEQVGARLVERAATTA